MGEEKKGPTYFEVFGDEIPVYLSLVALHTAFPKSLAYVPT